MRSTWPASTRPAKIPAPQILGSWVGCLPGSAGSLAGFPPRLDEGSAAHPRGSGAGWTRNRSSLMQCYSVCSTQSSVGSGAGSRPLGNGMANYVSTRSMSHCFEPRNCNGPEWPIYAPKGCHARRRGPSLGKMGRLGGCGGGYASSLCRSVLGGRRVFRPKQRKGKESCLRFLGVTF